MGEKRDNMQDIVEYFVKQLVENEEEVDIDMQENKNNIIFKISLNEDDRGAVIGVKGRRIKALKEIVHMEGFKTGKKVRLEVV